MNLDGIRVRATTKITDLSHEDPAYVIMPGDMGTIRSTGYWAATLDDFGIVWDKLPGSLNAAIIDHFECLDAEAEAIRREAL